MNLIRSLLQFAREARAELVEKTTWPTRDQVLKTTVAVLVSLVVVSIILFLVDFLVDGARKAFLVERVQLLQGIFTPLTFVVFVVLAIAVPFLINAARKRFLP